MSEIMVGALTEFPDDEHRALSIDGFEIGVFRSGDRIVAYRNRCPHFGGPVCQGRIFNRVTEVLGENQTSETLRFGVQRHIVCPWHGYEFDIETGRHPGDPTLRLVPVGIVVKDGQVYIDTPQGTAGRENRRG